MVVSEPGIVQQLGSTDFSKIAANIVLLFGFVATVVMGLKKGAKEFREYQSSNLSPKVQAAVLMENVTLSEWTASNKIVVEELRLLRTEITGLKHEMEIMRAVRSYNKD